MRVAGIPAITVAAVVTGLFLIFNLVKWFTDSTYGLNNATSFKYLAILYVLGGGVRVPGIGSFQAPLVQGFAVTLALGVLVSMFSALVVTRVLLRLLLGTGIARRPDYLGANLRPMADVRALGSES